jgi:hypothetical protein
MIKMTEMTNEQIINCIKRLIKKYMHDKEYADEKIRKYRRRQRELDMPCKGVMKTWQKRTIRYKAKIQALNEILQIIQDGGVYDAKGKRQYI